MLTSYLKENKKIIEDRLSKLLIAPVPEYEKLYESMNYSLLLGGKRIRPILTKMVLDAFGIHWQPYLNSICAIELIHTYSLVHDDLPAMDNDDFRRGKATNHKVYGDGMAILAGDALLTMAFQIIASDIALTPSQKVAIIERLSQCAGPEGMVGGQSFDLLSEGKQLPLKELQILHKGKTGALFFAAVDIGLSICNISKQKRLPLWDFAHALGLLFQITDDILDVTGTLESLGKMPGSDILQDKATYVSILGLEEAKIKANEVALMAKASLAKSECNTKYLELLTDYLISRSC